jgi:hypothetical protein
MRITINPVPRSIDVLMMSAAGLLAGAALSARPAQYEEVLKQRPDDAEARAAVERLVK